MEAEKQRLGGCWRCVSLSPLNCKLTTCPTSDYVSTPRAEGPPAPARLVRPHRSTHSNSTFPASLQTCGKLDAVLTSTVSSITVKIHRLIEMIVSRLLVHSSPSSLDDSHCGPRSLCAGYLLDEVTAVLRRLASWAIGECFSLCLVRH